MSPALPPPDPADHAVDGFEISDDRSRLDFGVVHGFLTHAYWSPGIDRATVEAAHANSLCFGIYEQETGRQVGGARLITDYARFAYLADVFVLEAFRGRGLSKWLVASALAHPSLPPSVASFVLFTGDAHGLYEQFGFRIPTAPVDHIMTRPGPGTVEIQRPVRRG